MDEFKERVRKLLDRKDEISGDDLSTLLVYLSRDKKKIVYNNMVMIAPASSYIQLLTSLQLVKIRVHGEHEREITDQDANVASLKHLIDTLVKQINLLTTKVEILAKEARSAVSAKNRITALRFLRSKKLYESVLVRRSETLAQLEDTYNRIEEAADQIEAMKVMQTSTKVLRDLNVEIGGVQGVEKVLDDLNAEITKVEEIGDLLSEGSTTTQPIDDNGIEDELETLIRQDRNANEDLAALQTRQKLEALKPLPASDAPKVDTTKASSDLRHVDHELDDSILALERMSVDERTDHKATELIV